MDFLLNNMYVYEDTIKIARDLRLLIGRLSELIENKVINLLANICANGF